MANDPLQFIDGRGHERRGRQDRAGRQTGLDFGHRTSHRAAARPRLTAPLGEPRYIVTQGRVVWDLHRFGEQQQVLGCDAPDTLSGIVIGSTERSTERRAERVSEIVAAGRCETMENDPQPHRSHGFAARQPVQDPVNDPVERGAVHDGNYNDGMLAVRYLALAALAVWLGGMVVLAFIVAPATFRVLQDADPSGGRVIAGALFSELLSRFDLLAYTCGGVVLVALFAMKFLGPPPAAFVLRAAIVAAMLGIAVYSGRSVSREIARIQAAVATPVDELSAADPRRMRFAALHRTSTTLMTVNMGLGLVLLFWYARE
jgi:hypothetical protein